MPNYRRARKTKRCRSGGLRFANPPYVLSAMNSTPAFSSERTT
jgi:hypothetical protein